MTPMVAGGRWIPATIRQVCPRNSSSEASWGRLGEVPVDQEFKHLTDGPLSPYRFSERQVGLDLVAVATTVPVLYDVAGCRQVVDYAVGAAFCDIYRCGDVAQAHPGVTGDADEHAGMVCEEAPLSHVFTLSDGRTLLLVSKH